MAEKLKHVPPLDYKVHPDGSIELEQDYSGNVDRVFLHNSHVRLIFEEANHLLPPPPANELTKLLARQLCELRMMICGEFGHSPKIDDAITKLGAYCDALPDSVFPYDLYPDDPEPGPVKAEADRPDFVLAHPASKER